MNPEAAKFLAIFIPLFLASILFIAFKLVYAAGKAMAEAKSIDPVSVGIVILILVLVGIGIRYYPPWIGRAAIDSFRDVWGLKPEIEGIITEVINDSSESWNGGNQPVPTSPVVINTDQPAIIITSTPFPNYAATATAQPPTLTPTPTPPMSLHDFEATATKMAEGNPTPKPTVFLCLSADDVAKGCQPPTPIP